MSIHHGRGSEAKGIHFFQTIRLPQLQSKDLVSILTLCVMRDIGKMYQIQYPLNFQMSQFVKYFGCNCVMMFGF
jgi:hypothetical protein